MRKRRSRVKPNVAKKDRPRAARQSRAPRTAAQYNAKPETFKQMYDRVVSAVSSMRSRNVSLQKAATEAGVSPRSVKRWAGSMLQKRANGKWVAKRSDTLLRSLKIPTPEGPREIAVRGSKLAAQIAEYWNAVHRYLQTGDESQLKKFRGKSFKDANGEQIVFPTERSVLNRLGSAGVLSFESLYSRSS